MKIISFILILFAFLIWTGNVSAALDCTQPPDIDKIECKFGTIQPPDPLKEFLGTDQTGAGAISLFLSNLVTLFYTLAAIVAVFMFLWAAFEWMTSGGDKEKVAAARNKVIYTIIGLILLSVAFAVMRVFGQFTGFTFFARQNWGIERDAQGNITKITCPDGYPVIYVIPRKELDPSACEGHGT